MKICSKCKIEKPEEEFHKDKRTTSGLYSACKGCHYQYSRTENNKATTKKNAAKYRQIPQNIINDSIKSGIKQSLKAKRANKTGRNWQILVGYTVDDLVLHLESKFEAWMTWENYGEWEMDHIKPKSLFKYETTENPEIKKCWALRNIQPLRAIENRKKGVKFNNEL